MKRTADKRGLLRSIFLADPYRKLISIGFAVGLWFYLDSQVSATERLDLALGFLEETREESWLLSEPDSSVLWVKVPPVLWTVRGYQNAVTGQDLTSVTLDFTGPKHVIERIREEELLFIASNPAGGDPADLQQQGGFEFSVNDVRALLEFQVPIQEMIPPRVKVVLERNQDKPIVLKSDLINFELPPGVGDPEKYRSRIDFNSPLFSAPDVALFGPQNEFDAMLAAPKLFRVSLSERAPDRVGGNLVLLPEFEDFSMTPELPNVSLPLDLEPIPFTLRIPFLVDDRALPEESHGRYGPSEPDREVTILASGDLADRLRSFTSDLARQEWATENMRLYVLLPRGFDPAALNVQNAKLRIPNLEIPRRYFQLPSGVVTVNIVER